MICLYVVRPSLPFSVCDSWWRNEVVAVLMTGEVGSRKRRLNDGEWSFLTNSSTLWSGGKNIACLKRLRKYMSIDWLTDWLIDWLTDWLTNDCPMTDWQTDWLTVWLITLTIDWLIDWLAVGWMDRETEGWLNQQRDQLMTDRQSFSLISEHIYLY